MLIEESIYVIRELLYDKAADILKTSSDLLYKLDTDIELNLIEDLKCSSLKRINGYKFVDEDSISTEYSDDIIIVSKFKINDINIVRFYVKYVPEIISDVFIININNLKTLKNVFK